jgi:hypothetical protein
MTIFLDLEMFCLVLIPMFTLHQHIVLCLLGAEVVGEHILQEAVTESWSWILLDSVWRTLASKRENARL